MSATTQERPTGHDQPEEQLGRQELRESTHLGGFVMAGIIDDKLLIATAMTGTSWRAGMTRYTKLNGQGVQRSATVYGDEFEGGRRIVSRRDISRPSNFAPRVGVATRAGILPRSITADFEIRTAPDGITQHAPRIRAYQAELGVDTPRGIGSWMSILEPSGRMRQPYEGGPRQISLEPSAEDTARMLEELIDKNGHNLVSLAVQAVILGTGEAEPLVVISRYSSDIVASDRFRTSEFNQFAAGYGD